MSRSMHFISKTIPGCGPPDGICLPCSGSSGRALSMPHNSSRSDYKLSSDVKFLSVRCASRYTSTVCNANHSNYRRNSDFSKQNKQGFSRNRNRNNEEREGFEDMEESETLSSKNGSFLSGSHKYQATATPGPREKEIVELFRKVQAQLRERAAIKEERKVDDSQGKSKESETVDSLLKLLRKHSVQQGKKSNNNNSNNSNRDFILDQQEQVGSLNGKRSTSISDSSNPVKHEVLESPKPPLTRPKSNFSKRSPVPEIKFPSVYSAEGSVTVNSSPDIVDGGRKAISLERESVDIDSDSEADPLFQEENVFDEILEDEISEIYESEHEEEVVAVVAAKEEDVVGASDDLSGMKMTELRALAKSRGMKGFSKLKKNELVELLSRSEI
ncbi:hypothetical protein ABFS82_04G041600 [Erythranthe guttata]|uniref:Rho termination factor-like N-terminal domain-containing protein n=1 Tax=Erythranthe guttata TaxID=4155 RepID=A0A022S2I8_ERYGU|nr:PREDICTED: rho-N domain-containing protein 1, chloroplastic [Erythranthe guttata]EYU46451.1 hypothetical protein MIMGU_mgv1a008104mg [Erythranthe guttata]|eukprot:XP_012831232.1 PREDICTED: rho-N domain-containing protein 1, chloroplastic [Erythranthe guttata]